MPAVDIVISNKLGLHARAAAKLTQLASSFNSEVFIARGQNRVNAKSIMGVMLLAAGKGLSVTVDAEGDDAGAHRDLPPLARRHAARQRQEDRRQPRRIERHQQGDLERRAGSPGQRIPRLAARHHPHGQRR